MMRPSMFCCEALAKEVRDHKPFVGGGGLYPESARPYGQIEQRDNGSWSVHGCCGGGCTVIDDMKFCPFCGTKLPEATS
jgi:hypothetical protein